MSPDRDEAKKATAPAPAPAGGGGRLSYESDDAELLPSLRKKGYRTVPVLHVNGGRVPPSLAALARPHQTLLSYLRDVLRLTGSKLGCGEGGCGACTVMISRYGPAAATTTAVATADEETGTVTGTKRMIVHRAVNACLTPVLAADGCHVTTVEGVGSVARKGGCGGGGNGNGGGLHPVQRAMVEMHGSQCGFCTPGIIVSIYALLADTHGDTGGNSDTATTATTTSTARMEEHLDGNLCRCTGYRPIWDAARALCDDWDDADGADNDDDEGVRGPCGTPCRECPERAECEMECNLDDKTKEKEGEEDETSKVCTSTSRDKGRDFRAALLAEEAKGAGDGNGAGDASAVSSWRTQPDDMFPDALSDPTSPLFAECAQPLVVIDDGASHSGSLGGTWFEPKTLVELLRLLALDQDGGGGRCKIVGGNTEVGIEAKFKGAHYERLVHPSPSIEELHGVHASEDGSTLKIGACAPLADVQEACDRLCKGGGGRPDDAAASDVSAGLRKIAAPTRDMLRWFASTQIRNAACLGGNLATASPISDMNPLLAALGATLVIASLSLEDGRGGGKIERREVKVSDFFRSYRTVDLEPNEVIERIDVPALRCVGDDGGGGGGLEYASAFKQARRREDDISIVTSGMRLQLEVNADNNGYVIGELVLAFGGMAPTTILPPQAAAGMVGEPFEEDTFARGGVSLMEELRLPEDVPGGQAQYRAALAASFLRKFYYQTVEKLERDVASVSSASSSALPPAPVVREEERSGARTFLSEGKPSTRGVQTYPAPRVAVGMERHGTDGKLGDEQGGNGDDNDGKTDDLPVAMAAAAAVAKSSGKSASDVVGKSTPHASAPLHCTGEALYTDDVPLSPSTLHGALVLADRCAVRLGAVDATPALAIPGVVGVYSHKDLLELGGDNTLGPIVHDETVFLPQGEKVAFVGQVLGICVGETLEAAERGARAVRATYEEAQEGDEEVPVVSIEQAIAAGSFYDFARHVLERGDVDSALSAASSDGDAEGKDEAERLVTVSGSFRCGGQEHFYLETNSTLAVPSDGGADLTVYCSTQAPTKTQMYCASATGMSASRVVVRMKRMGGGFGGKETRSVFASCAAAVAAKLTLRPVRLTLDRDVDMSITGGRHAFFATYRASASLSASSDGTRTASLRALDVKLYSNGGSGFDLSGPVMDRALFHVDGCYHWPHFRAEGVPCRTAQAPHTAFRGFGGPQGMVVCEHIMDHLSLATGVEGDALRRTNMYQVGQALPYGMILGEEHSGKWNVPRMWDRLHLRLDVGGRRKAVAEFNRQNRWRKRGLALVPTKFGIAFTAKFMNQGGALVHLYTDGTVLVTHGGTEMGQGLHTKVCQIAAQALGIPLSDVYINDTSTDKIANTIPTAASMSTDMYGMATLDACRHILGRLEPIRMRLGPEASLKEVAQAAHFERIDLSARGFFALDDRRCGYDWAENNRPNEGERTEGEPENAWRGHPFNYFTQGVVCTEVEVDVLTGDHQTLSSDVLVDVGSSINPVIDIGQVEGAFIQGMGWSTLEEVVYSDPDHKWIRPTGKLFTAGPGTYKIPAFNDVPEEFNVSLLEDADNPFAVHSSKAVGEPPFFLGCSVFYAIKEAVGAARRGEREANEKTMSDEEYFEMRMPATSERIRMLCGDDIGAMSIVGGGGGAGPSSEKAVKCFQPKGSH